jgi:hypothetical protein
MKPQTQASNLGRPLALAALVLLFTQTSLAASKYKVLHNFDGTDGVSSWGGVMLDPNGDVLGTGVAGGTAGGCNGGGCGTVYELTLHANGKWADSVLYDFTSANTGAVPYGHVVAGASGTIYGTTTEGPNYPGGTVFSLTPGTSGWDENVLYAFCAQRNCDDGDVPIAGVIMDATGNLYGTTPGSGVNQGGVVFELTSEPGGWKEKVLHSFYPSSYNQPAPGGTGPYAGLIMDSSGNLYGTTASGGANCRGWSCGTVYELTPRAGGGWKEIVLHRFHINGKDGSTPGWGALFMDSSGNLYGTTATGGCCGGVVFELTPGVGGKWKETILYDFKQDGSGYLPNAGVVMDKSGNLYGVTDAGGYGDCCVIYKLASRPKGKWAYTVLHTFGQGYDGCQPEGNLVLDNQGNLYGGTVLGGTAGNGVIFELTP